ncbi:hypothetical protein ABZ590_12350 [Streptomyces hirsutus]|uniref:hypothetical protein n=1 Tax=Streptomyces hirsutus TaxID=35620 RepID=UPI0033EDBC28
MGKNTRPAGLLAAALMTVTGCTAQSATPEAEPDLCPPPAYAVDISPPHDAGPVEDVDLGDLECADEATGMSTVEVTATNDDPDRDARYEITVEFLAADGDVVATETVHLGTVAAQSHETDEVFAARPDNGKSLAVRLIKVKRKFAADELEQLASSNPSALEAAMKVFVREGLVPSGTPYGACPAAAPQAWWIGEQTNCWTPRSAPPAAPTAPVPVHPGTVCADGWISGSAGRGTCSHHGGIAP